MILARDTYFHREQSQSMSLKVVVVVVVVVGTHSKNLIL